MAVQDTTLPDSAHASAPDAGINSTRISLASIAVAALVFAFMFAIGSAPRPEDLDSVMRLVQVRDLMAGQGWYDLHQYRMGIGEEGTLMHWSRLVDAPLAMIIILGNAFGGFGETLANWLWPMATLTLCLYAMARIARETAGDAAIVPALVVGALTLWTMPSFKPGALDHHNVQLALTLLLLLQFVSAGPPSRRGLAAGIIAAMMMAVGMETVHVVAVGCLGAAAFLLVSETDRTFAIWFGAAFAVATAIGFAATVPASQYFAETCDSLGLPHVSLAAIGGGGLAAAGMVTRGRGPAASLAALGFVGLVAGALVLFAFGDCIRYPMGRLEPDVYTFWLDTITEAEPLLSIAASNHILFASAVGTPLIAFAVLGHRFLSEGATKQTAVLAAVLVACAAIMVHQIRGASFVIAIAVPVLAGWIGALRRRADESKTVPNLLAMAGSWIVSINLFWCAVALGLLGPVRAADEPAGTGPGIEAQAGATGDSLCYSKTVLQPLAALPAGRVLAVSNMTPAILSETAHSAVGGNYHRNPDGILAVIRTFDARGEDARKRLAATGSVYVAVCPGNPETGLRTRQAPQGLLAQLTAGNVPDWLELVSGGGDGGLSVYAVRSK